MSEPLSSEKRAPMEDWCGSDLDNAGAVEILRTFNGFIVTTRSHDRATLTSQTLVFQDTEKLCDWIFHWHEKTRSAK